MKRLWNKFLTQVQDVTDELRRDDCPEPYYRGHADSTWSLMPSLGRESYRHIHEDYLYFRFESLGGHLIPIGASSWDILFLMQHHGLPTRLLDWTENFSIALYFAIQGCESEGAIWIIDPYELNRQSIGEEVLTHLNSSYQKGYIHYFTDSDEIFPADVLAIGSDSRTDRIRSQRGVFTLHRELKQPLEALYPNAVKKILIPKDIVPEAKRFLRLAGINNFSLFPDLDGLARYLISEHPKR